MSLFSTIGCFIGQVILALIILQIILVILLTLLIHMGFNITAPLVPIVGYSLNVAGSSTAAQKPMPNIASTEACAALASKNNASVAAYIPALKVCTLFTDPKGLKLTTPAMVVLSNIELPVA
jgi:hypothetical protein